MSDPLEAKARLRASCPVDVADDVRALLAENERLSMDLCDARHSLAHCVPGRREAVAEVARLTAEVERLRTERNRPDLEARVYALLVEFFGSNLRGDQQTLYQRLSSIVIEANLRAEQAEADLRESCKVRDAEMELRERAEAALAAAQKRIAVHEEWERGHAEAHERAVDDCPHDEKTWTCCATCHCVTMEKLAAANERAEKAENALAAAQEERRQYALDAGDAFTQIKFELAAANERAEKLLEIAMDCAPTRTREALRPTSPEAELPLGHEFLPHDMSTWYRARNRGTCILCRDAICHEWKPKKRMAGQYCGLPESAHRAAPETVHQCPPKGSGVMPCCGRTPFETLNDRMTLDPALVTCGRAAQEKP